MPPRQVCIWAKNMGVGVRQWTVDTMGIWQDKGGFTTQWIDYKVRERIWEIAQKMSIVNKQGAGPKQWDHLFNRCVTRISDLDSNKLLWKWYMADRTNLQGQIHKVALNRLAEVGFHGRKHWLKATLTKRSRLVHDVLYFIAPMLLWLLLIICISRRQQGRNNGSYGLGQ